MVGTHCIKTWSTTQAVIALSSGEAEYYGLVKAASVGLGIQGIYRDLGHSVKVRLHTDASAAKGIASRRGTGKIKHIEVNQLWLQEKVASGKPKVEKVSTEDNLADALTKGVGSDILVRHLEGVGAQVLQGRHPLAPICEAPESSS